MFIEIGIAATVGSIAGYIICAVMTVSKVSDLNQDVSDACDDYCRVANTAHDLRQSNTRLADACLAKQVRIDRALAVETPKAAHGVRKMAAILRGEQ